MKHGHVKSRLDECKKFDEECKLRYVAEKMMQIYQANFKKIFLHGVKSRAEMKRFLS